MGLSLGLGIGLSSNRSPNPASVPDIICGAIHSHHQINATDKGKALVLSPHVVYWNAGQPDVLRLDAVVVSEDGVAPNKPKLKSFQLADLQAVSALATPFEPFADFLPDNPKYAGKTRCIVQTV